MKYLFVDTKRKANIFLYWGYQVLTTFCFCLGTAQAAAAEPTCLTDWPAWQNFKSEFISEGGRVVDGSTPRKQTVSEGQAYALFFALVANDRKAFDKILRWTENNLANGDLTSHLPAWLWGRKDDGSWGVLDSNPASDADLWIVYALGEAGRLWGERRFVALSSLLASRILREETADLPGLGPTLLPAPRGFQTGVKTWRLNPSYLPMQLMDWLSSRSSDSTWQRISESSQRILLESAPNGFSPDWTVYQDSKGFRIDSTGKEKGTGGYNAIRVYLWAGMLAPDASARPRLLTAFSPMASFVMRHGYPPESVNIITGEANGPGPSGFSSALLPFLAAREDSAALQAQRDRLTARPPRPDAYYEQALSLFAYGWMDGHYRFATNGSLLPSWQKPCGSASSRLPSH
ncbi:endo-1,4-D-glucanase [Candidatus Nitrotoga sp. HW29]|uniref:cellulose synthase complex periplasmic endoglucanase BcsZ n=1 Tax=Candidatus Nitrotoga sp. HW29 TaxID=2886963 RepID=UPI001EF34DE7|nr:cellulose synthase complex periplasmic endoglucanase BcsZ [Candidatus Nitrotoga sp. HW29]CAH1903781.1 endo-1,4-D-glucanase [Candidatus Nitrotoga sp. HW29]